MKGPVIFGLVVLALVIVLFFVKRGEPQGAPSKAPGTKIIYGRMSCPYTVKQVDKYPDATFVDCSTPGSCPDFVKAFPTTQNEDGTITVGFN
jgi:hypothetical protein